MMRSLYRREGMSCAPMRAALLNAFFAAFADQKKGQLLGVRSKLQPVRTPFNERRAVEKTTLVRVAL